MNVKKILSLAASTIRLFIIILLFTPNSKAEEKNIKYYSDDKGILSLMYHRFDEDKYPSTNIQMDIFKQQIEIIRNLKYNFYDPKDLVNNFHTIKIEKKILITIDDAFSSFYKNAWPYLKEEKIPFILFISTEAVGENGYMTWDQIIELEKENTVYIGNHSHTHNYLVNLENDVFIKDINTAKEIFNRKLGYSPIFFSYPFGEYSNDFKKIIENFGFKYAFGQHSGVVDETKDFYELPRFPINETYGEMKRFELILKTIPLKVKSIVPTEKYIDDANNPPVVIVEFFEDMKNIKLLNCYSNELNSWRKSQITYLNNFKIKIKLAGKFTTERGRINCSLRETNGSWRWLGMQFVVAEL